MASVRTASLSPEKLGQEDAAVREDRMSECRRNFADWQCLRYALAAAMLCGLMLSPQLWLTGRSYPLVPVWDGLPSAPPPWDWFALGAMVAALGAIVAAPRPRPAMIAFVILAGLWSLGDQTRWQPWFYQYLVMLAVLALGPAPEDSRRCGASLNACRFIVAGLYFWSGVQKMNVLFAADVFPQLTEPLLSYLPAGWYEALCSCGWEAACLECSIGLGLLVRPLRPVAVGAAVIMHLLALFCLGPWGLNWNTVVWPWNAAMIVFVVVLFGRTRRVQPRHILWPPQGFAARMALVLFGIMPLLNFFGCWDSYLSGALYSGNTPGARIYISREVYAHLPPEAITSSVHRKNAAPDDPCPYEVDLLGWAMAEMNVPNYPAERVARGIARRLAELPEKSSDADPEPRSPQGDHPQSPRVILILQERAHWRTGERLETRIAYPKE